MIRSLLKKNGPSQQRESKNENDIGKEHNPQRVFLFFFSEKL